MIVLFSFFHLPDFKIIPGSPQVIESLFFKNELQNIFRVSEFPKYLISPDPNVAKFDISQDIVET